MTTITFQELKQHYKKTLLLAYPVCISQMGHMLVGIADTFMVGQLGIIELAAAAFANSIFVMVLVFGIGLSMSITPLVASADATKNFSEKTSILRNGLFVCVSSGILLFLVLFFSSPLMNYFNQEKNVIDLAIPFFNILIFSLIPLMIFAALKQFAEGLSFTRQAMYISVAGNIANIILNYLLIYGKLGFPELGFIGSAWATFVSRIMMAAAMIIFIWNSPLFVKVREGLIPKDFSILMIKKMFRIGIPTGFQFLFEVAAFSLAAVMVGWIGARELAAHQVALSLASLTYMVASGIAAAATVRVGNSKGGDDVRGVRIAGLSAIHLVFCVMTFFSLIFFAFNDFLPGLFIKEKDVILTASGLLIMAGIFQISDGIQCVALGILRGLQDVRIPTIVALVSYWLIALPLGYYFGFILGYGIYGIWTGLVIGLTVAAILLYMRFSNRTRPARSFPLS